MTTKNNPGEQPVNEIGGWTVTDPKYGVWFITKAAVIADWKQDREQAYPGEPVPAPDEETIETWFNEQISWIEVHRDGVQIAGPDMQAWEQRFYEEMRRNSNSVSHSNPVKHSINQDY